MPTHTHVLAAFLLAFPVSWASGAPREIVIEGTRTHGVHVQGISGNFGNQATADLVAALRDSGVIHIAEKPEGAFVAAATADGTALKGVLKRPDGGVHFSRDYNGPALKGNVQDFARDIIGALGGKDTPNLAGKIVFTAGASGKREIHLVHHDGTGLRKLTSDGSLNVSPSISPDGSHVAHTSYRSGYADVYYLNLATGTRSRIIKSPGTNSGAAISPDGRRIALTMSFVGNPEVFVTTTGGGNARRLTHSPGSDSSPCWSPDGSQIAYTSDGGGSPRIHIVPASGGAARALATGYGHCTEPNWSPDGKRLAFCVRQGGGMAVAVYDFASGKSRIIGTSSTEAAATSSSATWRALPPGRSPPAWAKSASPVGPGAKIPGVPRDSPLERIPLARSVPYAEGDVEGDPSPSR